ncbi:hypothetical protein F5Y18DRAFT_435010 [Xylariaceae sp. FL1019]|nr:hypothetical protein F5Y18DRAFT_435010 [Xylariaceae sp. FL1019]
MSGWVGRAKQTHVHSRYKLPLTALVSSTYLQHGCWSGGWADAAKPWALARASQALTTANTSIFPLASQRARSGSGRGGWQLPSRVGGSTEFLEKSLSDSPDGVDNPPGAGPQLFCSSASDQIMKFLDRREKAELREAAVIAAPWIFLQQTPPGRAKTNVKLNEITATRPSLSLLNLVDSHFYNCIEIVTLPNVTDPAVWRLDSLFPSP